MLDPTQSDLDIYKLTWLRDAILKRASTIKHTLGSFNAKFIYNSDSLQVINNIPI